MTVKERINSIFAKYDAKFAAEDVKPEDEETKLSEVELEDGTVINSEDEEVVVGSQVTVENADKEMIAVPSGDYTAKDGRVMTIKDGIVEAIAEVEQEEEVEVEVEQEEETPEAIPQELKDLLTALKAEFSELQQEFAEVKSAKESVEAELEEVKANFQAQGLPQTKQNVEEVVQLQQKDVKAMSTKERIAHINKVYKNKK